MITKFDDYLIHQTPMPIASVGTTDTNAYDRYFFEGFTADASLVFGAAFGFYPNREVVDGAFSVSIGGTQYSIFASDQAPVERANSTVGPISIEILAPMRRVRVRIDDVARQFRADLVFEARTGVMEEGREVLTDGARTTVDMTRYSQLGTWSGWIDVKGHRVELEGQNVFGVRDHSWGIRPLGGPGVQTRWSKEFYWFWSPTFFPDTCLHWHLTDNNKGEIPHRVGALLPLCDAGDSPLYMRDVGGDSVVPVRFVPQYVEGTRRIKQLDVELNDKRGPRMQLQLVPNSKVAFSLTGLGYINRDWEHGTWKGPSFVDENAWPADQPNPVFKRNSHIHHVCTVTRDDGVVGHAILEQCIFGPHAPSGLTGVMDGFRSQSQGSA